MDSLISFLYILAFVTNIIITLCIYLSRKKLGSMSLIFILILLASDSLFIYSTSIESSSFEVTHYTIKIFHGTDNSIKLRIAFIADSHVNSIEDINFLERVVDELNRIDADYIVIGGDLIDYREEDMALLTPLLDIRDKDHTIIVLGNHDYGRGWSNIPLANKLALWLESNGFIVLRNENRAYRKDNHRFFFVGVDSLWSKQIDFDEAYKDIDLNCTTILLSHNPDVVFLLDKERTDLILSGHTHGGQVCLPFVGAPWIPSRIKDGCGRGLYEINNRKLFITKGLTGPIRFNAKPEIAVLELT